MKIIVTGATGMVGAEVLRQAILDDKITEVIALVRGPIEIEHPKIKTIIHKDFMDYTGLEEVFKNTDVCLWCLGISQTQVNKEKYHEITYDYTMAAAKAMVKAKPDLTFIFTSGEGADQTEKSRTIFARVKGKTENALIRMGMKHLYIVRPAGIKPIHKNPKTSWFNKMFIPLFPIFEVITPNFVIASDKLAIAMLKIANNGYQETIIDNKKLKELSVS